MTKDTFGYREGEQCFRDGCIGIISETPSGEGGCSCHINPPCGHCTTDWAHCIVCDWRAADDDDYHAVMIAPGLAVMERVKPIPLEPRKIDYRTTSHSNSSQKVTGVYPEGTTREQVLARVKGTFGGRFNHFGGGKFEYIAYTD